jgi:hypothetical protein
LVVIDVSFSSLLLHRFLRSAAAAWVFLGSLQLDDWFSVVVVARAFLAWWWWWWSQVPFSVFGWRLEFADGLPAGLVAGGVEGL